LFDPNRWAGLKLIGENATDLLLFKKLLIGIRQLDSLIHDGRKFIEGQRKSPKASTVGPPTGPCSNIQCPRIYRNDQGTKCGEFLQGSQFSKTTYC
jgi:hypothetical protein